MNWPNNKDMSIRAANRFQRKRKTLQKKTSLTMRCISCNTTHTFQFHHIFLWAAFAPADLRWTYWRTVQSTLRKSWALLLVACTGKVGQGFVGETEWLKRMAAGAFGHCTKRLVKLTPALSLPDALSNTFCYILNCIWPIWNIFCKYLKFSWK